MIRKFTLVVLGALFCLPAVAHAQNCNSDRRPVPGTLAAANDPCAQPKAAPSREPVRKSEKKEDRPAFKSGNTTIYFGGSLGTEVGIRGR